MRWKVRDLLLARELYSEEFVLAKEFDIVAKRRDELFQTAMEQLEIFLKEKERLETIIRDARELLQEYRK